jgi:23S rRNA (cytosine1962-C5)-methyltransferase
VVTISRRAAARLRQGHLWVYRSDLARAGDIAPGALVSVADERGNLVGTAFYSSSSQIALRLLSPGPVAPGEPLHALLRQRLQTAIAYRQRVVGDSDACRLVFSEADGLPGLIVDRYSDILSLQVLTQAMDQPEVRTLVLDVLQEELAPAAIVERVDARMCELEQLPSRETRLLQGEKSRTVFTMNGVRFHCDALAGQKTGAFLDQRENYAAVARYAHGDALDVFCYQGGFALHLARACSQVTAVDSSRPALEAAEQNESLNRQAASQPEIEWIEADAFALLKDYAAGGRQFDTIVLDPPAFAKARKEVPAALRGYKEVNLRALKMLRPGGLLATCSCSYHVAESDFLDALRSAAADARRSPCVLEKRGQAKDHPALLNLPETAYLKCVILQV